MAESPPYRPAVVGRKGRRLTGGRQPLRYAAHLPGVGIQNIQFTGDRRGDIRRKPLRHLNHILNGFTALQPLSHTRQQLADRPVGVALLLQPLTGQAVLAKNADRLSHVTNLIHLGKVRRLYRIILGGETLDHVAQANHRVEHPAFENEAEDEQKHQGGQADHDFRQRTPDPRALGGLVDSDGGAMLKHLAEAIDLRLHALQFSLVRGAVQHRDGRWRIAASDMRQGRLLFIL